MFTLMGLVQPQSLEEAYEILMKRKNNIVIGGSAFLRMGEKRIGTGIDLSNLNLNLIEETSDYIKIGAMTTLRDLEVSPILNKYFNGVIGNCVKDIIGVQFRNVVTVGASVFSKYGFSDLIVALLSLDTEVELYKGGRVKLEEFLNQKYEKDILVIAINTFSGVIGKVFKFIPKPLYIAFSIAGDGVLTTTSPTDFAPNGPVGS